MSERKPIRVFYSPLSKRFYASQAYRQKGKIFEITGKAYDVTDDIASSMDTYGLSFSQEKGIKNEQIL